MRSSFPQLNANNLKTALVESSAGGNRVISYAALNLRCDRFAAGLLGGRADLEEERIAFFIPASIDYVTTLHGIWRAGGIAVPLNVASAVSELEHSLSSASVTRMVANGDYRESLVELCAALNIALVSVDEVLAELGNDKEAETGKGLPEVAPERRAMMLFTSGTTNKPKGVVSTHKTIAAQITTLVDAWAWSEADSIPLFLPLHHIHGIINILSCGLWAGATVDLYEKFDMPALCEKVAAKRYNVFMAVPTIYVKLIHYFESLDADAVERICHGFKQMRLNISGSAACPVKLFEQWQALTGQILLERYGMTEIGMGLSNPYTGERRAGHVGQALPGVQAKLFDEENNEITAEDTPGEIRVRGDNVFLEYWNNESATKESFVDGWFCTGDVAVIDKGYFRIMGRSSVDIIKSGGYKLSALEIEGTLLTHDDIAEVAVIGVEDETWGEAVSAFVVLKADKALSYDALKAWCDGKMSGYKVPKNLHVVDALPRNAMGKVTKPALKEQLT